MRRMTRTEWWRLMPARLWSMATTPLLPWRVYFATRRIVNATRRESLSVALSVWWLMLEDYGVEDAR